MGSLPPHVPTTRLLDGLKGIEIGKSLDNDFCLDALNVCPKEFENSENDNTPVDIYAYGDDMPGLDDNSMDFVFSSHVVEHLPNLIKALKEWNRIVKNAGYVVMIVPQRDARVNDRGRPLTTYGEILDDFEKDMTVDTHPFDEAINYRGGHYHVFNIISLMFIIQNIKDDFGLNWEMIGSENPDSRHGNGFWLAYRVKKC
jgi:ubiquinone/menaquinone biosynthesis C-methylase UbiE